MFRTTQPSRAGFILGRGGFAVFVTLLRSDCLPSDRKPNKYVSMDV